MLLGHVYSLQPEGTACIRIFQHPHTHTHTALYIPTAISHNSFPSQCCITMCTRRICVCWRNTREGFSSLRDCYGECRHLSRRREFVSAWAFPPRRLRLHTDVKKPCCSALTLRRALMQCVCPRVHPRAALRGSQEMVLLWQRKSLLDNSSCTDAIWPEVKKKKTWNEKDYYSCVSG